MRQVALSLGSYSQVSRAQPRIEHRGALKEIMSLQHNPTLSTIPTCDNAAIWAVGYCAGFAFCAGGDLARGYLLSLET